MQRIYKQNLSLIFHFIIILPNHYAIQSSASIYNEIKQVFKTSCYLQSAAEVRYNPSLSDHLKFACSTSLCIISKSILLSAITKLKYKYIMCNINICTGKDGFMHVINERYINIWNKGTCVATCLHYTVVEVVHCSIWIQIQCDCQTTSYCILPLASFPDDLFTLIIMYCCGQKFLYTLGDKSTHLLLLFWTTGWCWWYNHPTYWLGVSEE